MYSARGEAAFAPTLQAAQVCMGVVAFDLY